MTLRKTENNCCFLPDLFEGLAGMCGRRYCVDCLTSTARWCRFILLPVLPWMAEASLEYLALGLHRHPLRGPQVHQSVHLVHTLDSEQNLHVHSFLPSIEIEFADTLSARSFPAIQESLFWAWKTIANHSENSSRADEVKTAPPQDNRRNREGTTHTKGPQTHTSHFVNKHRMFEWKWLEPRCLATVLVLVEWGGRFGSFEHLHCYHAKGLHVLFPCMVASGLPELIPFLAALRSSCVPMEPHVRVTSVTCGVSESLLLKFITLTIIFVGMVSCRRIAKAAGLVNFNPRSCAIFRLHQDLVP